MGCNCSREEGAVIVNNQLKIRNNFFIKIHLPDSYNLKIIKFEGKTDYMLLDELFNKCLFCGTHAEELDANFISVYNDLKDEFDYFIQRLYGYEIEIEENPIQGNIWVIYINRIKYNFSLLCGNSRIVKKDDDIELKYEKFEEY